MRFPREGVVINRNKTQRLYREEKPAVQRRRSRRYAKNSVKGRMS
jgi:hypothetical protein